MQKLQGKDIFQIPSDRITDRPILSGRRADVRPNIDLSCIFSSLIVITFIDLDHQIIPDIISLPGIPLGFLASFIVPEITYKESLIGIVIGGGLLLLVAIAYEFIAKKEGMGGGDVKLLAMIGAFLGWKGVLFTIFSGSLVGTIIGVTIMVAQGKDSKYAIPFGPFLSMGALLYLFFGEPIIYWYLGML